MTILLILVILFPLIGKEIKAIILLIITVLILVDFILTQKIHIYKPFLVYLVFSTTIGLFFVLYGVIQNNPGALASIPVMIIYPLVFSLLLCLYKERDYKTLQLLFIILLFLNLSLFIIFILSKIGILSDSLSLIIEMILEDKASFGLANGMGNFSLPSMVSILFLLPFLFYTTVLGNYSVSKSFMLYGLTLITVILMIISGRRGLIIMPILSVIIIFPIYVVFVRKSSSKHNRSFFNRALVTIITSIVMVFGVTVMLKYGVLNFESATENILSAFNFTSNKSNNIRAIQFVSLLNEIEYHPFIGSGAGAVASYIRENKPWEYELSYIALIYHFGILAFMFYSFGVLWVLASLLSIARKVPMEQAKFLIGIASGYLSFIMGNATNPYLLKFDFMWVIFLPAALVSFYNIRKNI